MQRHTQQDGREHSRHPVIRHDAPAAAQFLETVNGPRLQDIEYSKKYKTQKQVFPVGEAQGEKNRVCREVKMGHQVRQGDGDQWQQQGQVLAGHFVNDHVLGVLDARVGSHARRAPNSKSG